MASTRFQAIRQRGDLEKSRIRGAGGAIRWQQSVSDAHRAAARNRRRGPIIAFQVWERNGHQSVVKALNRPRYRATGKPLSAGIVSNDLWCANFKGEFKLGNGHYCYPLTVTDHVCRFLLLCEALESTSEDTAITALEQLFLERGLPAAIRSDNGVPFASPNALFNLSKLSVWWVRLGIGIERIKP